MSRVREMLLADLTDYYRVQEYIGPTDKITNFSEQQRSGGYCDTCYYEYTALVFTVEREDGSNYEQEDRYMSISDFLNSI